jgi:hypothetical protein
MSAPNEIDTLRLEWPMVTPCVPSVSIEIEYEGRVTVQIRGANGDERQAEGLIAWVESDPELSALVDLARRLRERMRS